ncbi:sensor histidine kinase, partial [Desulfurivibrio sp. C05AmB]
MKQEHAECLLQNAGINFFGTVVAVITHELKNVLAIINENKGLLEDFAHLARQEERELEPDTALTTAAAIGRQVERADIIIKNLNRFAHSPDQEVKILDLG